MRRSHSISIVVVGCLTTAVACTDAVAPTPATPRVSSPTLSVGTQQFCSTGTIVIPGIANTAGPADPYPSAISVSGLGSSIQSVTATLRDYRHQFAKDVNVLLVGPTGANVFLMSATGGADDQMPAVNLTFDDAALGTLPVNTVAVSGTYKPTPSARAMSAPAPQPPYGTALAAFAGTNPNGTWQLYVTDSDPDDGGAINGGWCIDITTRFAFGGFTGPVDPAPTVNRAKAGGAIPVKFNLGGNQGLAIMAPDYPASQPMSCDTSLPTDDLEETVNAGNSSLTYDAGSGLYTYVWKTDKAWANSCRALTVKLVDGAEYTALFKFAK